MNRTQIYLDAEQTTRLDRRAAVEGTSRSMLIRRAIDTYLSHGERDAAAWQARWRQAVDDTAGAAPYLEEGAEYVEDVRRDEAARLDRLAR